MELLLPVALAVKVALEKLGKLQECLFLFKIKFKNLERALSDLSRGNDTQAKQRHARAR